ncbi:TetR family transcriptional regulator C-terminal domain-containing protein [Roseibium aquae]|uniref:TetR family transcriptional regulator C-terminal domain-containing protein n=1 Tax=Roseibium aquae TaxID=1323746 RepID=UPI001AD8F190|nr:TetR family transcriptional regulator C-terminal domain-containing protein [Roseibium aquae]
MKKKTQIAQGSLSRIQEKNRALILEAALQEFSKVGYSGATVERIATAAGMSKSNLLYYFPSKAAMYESVLGRILDDWLAPLRTLDPLGDPAQELRAYIGSKLTISARHPQASRLFANEIMRGAPRLGRVLETDLKALVADKCDVIESWIKAGKIRPVNPVHLIFTIWATTQHYADFAPQVRAITGTDLSDPDFFAETEKTVTDLILAGLGLQMPQAAKVA